MKTIAFFHRLDLAELFAPMSLNLPADMRAVHMAYSEDEAARLRAQGITEITVFKAEVARRLADSHAPDADRLAQMEADIQAATQGAFSLNAAIQSDRTFPLLSYGECLHLSSIYLEIWEEFCAAHEVDHILHEPVAIMMTFAAAVAVTKRGGSFLYFIQAQAKPGSYDFAVMQGVELFCPDMQRALQDPARAVRPTELDRDGLRAFLDSFRSDIANFQGGVVAQSVSYPILLAKALRNHLRRMVRIGRLDRLVDAIEVWELRQNLAGEKIRNLIGYRRKARFDDLNPEETFWFYPLHLEPEAVVLYLADGLYTNQVKLIENIAAQLPPGHFLYVKDHPHDIGYRAPEDYQRLNAVPNVRLLKTGLSGKEVIRNARGVITISGSAGFEAMLMGKPVVTFARTFYSERPGVRRVRHIRDLRDALAELEAMGPMDDGPILDFLRAYLSSIHPGMTGYFAGRARQTGLDLDENARLVTEGLVRSLRAT